MNWKAASLAIVAALFTTYQEIKDDWDDNPNSEFELEIVLAPWSVALGLLWGTTTIAQTQTIAKKEAERIM
jgi:hypothetical protein